jgi:hypothetical protein
MQSNNSTEDGPTKEEIAPSIVTDKKRKSQMEERLDLTAPIRIKKKHLLWLLIRC